MENNHLLKLINTGSSCYFNSAIQCIFSIPLIKKYLSDINNWEKSIIYDDYEKSLTYKLFLLTHTSGELLDITDIFNTIRTYKIIYKNLIEMPYNEFMVGKQDDAFVMFNAILDLLHYETKQINNEIIINNSIYNKLNPQYKKISLTDIDIPYNYEELIYFGYRFIQDTYKKEYSDITGIFDSFIINITQCLNDKCNDQSYSLSKINSLDIDIYSSGLSNSTHSLESYLDAQQHISEYSDKNKHRLLTGHNSCVKYIKFWRIPKVLVIRFNRFAIINGNKIKLYNKIHIPNILNLSNFIHKDAINEHCNLHNEYELVTTIQHNGSLDNGHYFVYSKINNYWYELNDHKITKLPSKPYLDLSYVVVYQQKKMKI